MIKTALVSEQGKGRLKQNKNTSGTMMLPGGVTASESWKSTESNRRCEWGGEVGVARKMDEPNYPAIFLHGAEAQSKHRAEKEKVNNRNVSNDGGRSLKRPAFLHPADCGN